MLAQKYEYSAVARGTLGYEDYCSLRHEVFCTELQRVPPCERASGDRPMESDGFDEHSVHVLCRSIATGEAVGCARLILPGPQGLNVLSRYRLHTDVTPDAESLGEIGRLAISSQLRRYRRNTQPVDSALPADRAEDPRREVKRDGPTVALGLYREIFRLASEHGITHCYAAMEPSLSRMLNRLGFPFQEAGPINHAVHPPRQPYLIGAHAMRSGLRGRNSCLYRFIFGIDEPATKSSEASWSTQGARTAVFPMGALIPALA